MTLAAHSAHLLLLSNTKPWQKTKIVLSFISMSQTEAVAREPVRPRLLPRSRQKALRLPCCVCNHSHHPLLHLFTPLAMAGTYASSHPCKFGDKLNHSGGVCVCLCERELGSVRFPAWRSAWLRLNRASSSTWLTTDIITTTRNQLSQMKVICCYLCFANCIVKRRGSNNHDH